MILKTLTVKRSEWARGDINGPSSLVNEIDKKCCLGFFMKKCGVSYKKMKLCPTPNDVEYKNEILFKKVPQLVSFVREDEESRCPLRNTNFCDVAMIINDDKRINEETRENRLIELFKNHNIKLKFVN